MLPPAPAADLACPPLFWGSFSPVLVGGGPVEPVGIGDGLSGDTASDLPGVPGTAPLLGCWLGWRLWRRIWRPRVLDGP